MTTLN